jgi:hypothetical protein
MTTNRLARSESQSDQVFPPKGQSPEQKAARQQFWIDHGNRSLMESGRGNLEWCAKDGRYWIQQRI